jgi:hypothetical protein
VTCLTLLLQGVRDSHRGSPNNRGNPFSFANNETRINSQTINYTPRNHGLVTGAHGPGNHSGPPGGRPQHPSGETPIRSRGTTSYRRNSTSLEGWTPPRARLRLARGLDTPSGGSPPRSRAGRPLGRVSASLEALAGPPLPHPLPRPEHLML